MFAALNGCVGSERGSGQLQRLSVPTARAGCVRGVEGDLLTFVLNGDRMRNAVSDLCSVLVFVLCYYRRGKDTSA